VRPCTRCELASARAVSAGRRRVRGSLAACSTCEMALRPTSANISVRYSIVATGLSVVALMSEAAGESPNYGSIGPSTECSHMTISSAASAISVPPAMA
jgi:hypothetical protein